MKTIHLALFVALFGGFSLAQEPVHPNRILILENESVLEGRIEQRGNWYHIRQALGETVIPTTGVLKIVDSHADAYKYLQKRANLRDPDERIRLAKWCMTYNMRSEAVEQVEEALQLRPDDVYGRFIIKTVKEMPPVTSGLGELKKTPVAVVDTLLPQDFNQESLALFAVKVQPILMNSCASCHAGTNAGAFTLQRVHTSADKRGTLANLQMALKQIDKGDAGKSPLLEKAVSAHGSLKNSPLRGRESAPYRHLEEWVRAAYPLSPVAVKESKTAPAAPAIETTETVPVAVSKPLMPVAPPDQTLKGPEISPVETFDPFAPKPSGKRK